MPRSLVRLRLLVISILQRLIQGSLTGKRCYPKAETDQPSTQVNSCVTTAQRGLNDKQKPILELPETEYSNKADHIVFVYWGS